VKFHEVKYILPLKLIDQRLGNLWHGVLELSYLLDRTNIAEICKLVVNALGAKLGEKKGDLLDEFGELSSEKVLGKGDETVALANGGNGADGVSEVGCQLFQLFIKEQSQLPQTLFRIRSRCSIVRVHIFLERIQN
jgi:hypothetical protein